MSVRDYNKKRLTEIIMRVVKKLKLQANKEEDFSFADLELPVHRRRLIFVPGFLLPRRSQIQQVYRKSWSCAWLKVKPVELGMQTRCIDGDQFLLNSHKNQGWEGKQIHEEYDEYYLKISCLIRYPDHVVDVMLTLECHEWDLNREERISRWPNSNQIRLFIDKHTLRKREKRASKILLLFWFINRHSCC